MESQHSVYALFVGINEYQYRTKGGQSIDLGGCVNDVSLISGLLKARYNLTANQCVTLTNECATRAKIVDAFRNHLGKAKQGDSAIFYFSGHGSTEKADPRMWRSGAQGRRNETLVCHDSRAAELYDLSDKELRFLIHQLSEKGVEVITIIDSCNSGDATRYMGDEFEEVVRQTPGSNATRPLDSYLFFDDPEAKPWLEDFSLMPEGNHIALSACRNDQLSKEIYFDWEKYGAFTYSLCEAIKHQHFAPSYRNLVDAATQRVGVRVDNQTPQLEAVGEKRSIHQTFLSQDIQPVIYPVSYYSNAWWLSAGVAQGINYNARLDLLSDGKKVTEATVTDVSPTDLPNNGSRLTVLDGSLELDQQLTYQAQLVDPAIDKLPIAFIGQEQHTLAISKALQNSDTQHYVEPVDSAEYLLEASEQSIVFNRRLGLQLAVEPIIEREGNLPRELIALKLAAHMARWEHTKGLVYVLKDSLLPEGLVALVIRQQDPDSGNYVRLQNEDNAFNLYYQQSAKKAELIKPFIKMSLELDANIQWPNDEDAFVSLLLMDPVQGSTSVLANKAVLRLTERKDRDGTSSVIKPASPIWTYFRNVDGARNERVSFSVPKALLSPLGDGQTTDYLKLIVSNFEIDIGALEQSSLQALLTELNPHVSRQAKSMDDGDKDDIDSGHFIHKARTQTFAINVIKPRGSQFVDSQEAVALSNDIHVLAHDISAMASLEYAKDNPNSVIGLRLDLDDDSNKGLNGGSTLDKPLILEITTTAEVAGNEGLLLFSKEDSGGDDEEFEIPLGFGRYDGNGMIRVVINQLPETVRSGDRSVGGSLLLFFKKVAYDKLKLDWGTDRLAIAQFSSAESLEVADYIDDVSAIKNEIKQADKILLFLHGIIGDTQQMAGVVNRKVDGVRLGKGYLTLTFDYENLNTPIQETADLLRKNLEAVGLGGDHKKELVIIAHSMGGLVSRWMIEKDPACPTVSKLVMLGTPNGGSPFNHVKKWLVTMITLATNGIAGVAGGIGVAGLMYLLNNADDTLDEMGSNSKTLAYLYEANDPNIPYYMIAGETAQLKLALEDGDSRLNRLLSTLKQHSWLGVTDFFTKTLFHEANDIAVAHSSMASVPRGRVYEMPLTVVDADHTSYFVNKVAINYLHSILQGAKARQ